MIMGFTKARSPELKLLRRIAKVFAGDTAHIKAYKLKLKHFSKYIVEVNNIGHAIQYVVKFPNGYGASIIKMFSPSWYSNGEDWEIALVRFFEHGTWHVTCDSRITLDVTNGLSRHDVRRVLAEIRKLPRVA